MRRDIIIIILIIVILFFLFFAYSYFNKPHHSKEEIIKSILEKGKNSIQVYSDDFNDQDFLSFEFTCDGSDTSPDIRWENIPSETKSITVIVYDPDAPKDYFIHWIVYNLPPNIYDLPRGSSPKGSILLGKEGENDFGEVGYRGPCPPRGSTHRYVFLVIALDDFIRSDQNISQDELLNLIEKYAIAYGYITGLYRR